MMSVLPSCAVVGLVLMVLDQLLNNGNHGNSTISLGVGRRGSIKHLAVSKMMQTVICPCLKHIGKLKTQNLLNQHSTVATVQCTAASLGKNIPRLHRHRHRRHAHATDTGHMPTLSGHSTYISTRSTRIPHGSVQISRCLCNITHP